MVVGDLLNLAITIALAIAFVTVTYGRFLDIKVVKYEADQMRESATFLQALLTSSDILLEDTSGNKVKNFIDYTKFNNPQEFETSISKFLRHYNPYLSFNLNITSLLSHSSQSLNFFEFNISTPCYAQYDFYRKMTVEANAFVCKSLSVTSCEPVLIRLTTYKSPLTELGYWISQLCMRTESFIKSIPIDTKTFVKCPPPSGENCGIEIKEGDGEICSWVYVNSEMREICVPIYCEKDMELKAKEVEETCTTIEINYTGSEVYVEVPGYLIA